MKKEVFALSVIFLFFTGQSLAQSQPSARINAMCNSYANMARIANPDVVYKECLYGARDAKLKNGAICEHKNQQFNAQASSLHGMDRAEFIEVGQAYRVGCNAGR